MESRSGLRMRFGKIVESFPCDDVHCRYPGIFISEVVQTGTLGIRPLGFYPRTALSTSCNQRIHASIVDVN